MERTEDVPRKPLQDGSKATAMNEEPTCLHPSDPPSCLGQEMTCDLILWLRTGAFLGFNMDFSKPWPHPCNHYDEKLACRRPHPIARNSHVRAGFSAASPLNPQPYNIL